MINEQIDIIKRMPQKICKQFFYLSNMQWVFTLGKFDKLVISSEKLMN